MEGGGSNAQSNLGSGANNIRLPVNSTMESGVNWFNNIRLLDYSATDKHKCGFQRADNPADRASAVIFRWANTAAITSVEFAGNNNPFSAGSTFALYGIPS
jgi:hypothetical protein